MKEQTVNIFIQQRFIVCQGGNESGMWKNLYDFLRANKTETWQKIHYLRIQNTKGLKGH